MNTVTTHMPRWLPLAQWLASSGHVGPTSMALGAALTLSLLATGRPDWVLCAVAWMLVFVGGHLRRVGVKVVKGVKGIAGAKPACTAFFWGLFAVFAWWFVGGPMSLPALAGAFTLLAVRVGFNALFCELKDIQRDRAAGVATVATWLGREGLLHMLIRVESLWPLALLALVAMQWLPPLALTLALTTFYAQAVYMAAAQRWLDDETLCKLVADAEMLLWPVFLGAGFALGTAGGLGV